MIKFIYSLLKGKMQHGGLPINPKTMIDLLIGCSDDVYYIFRKRIMFEYLRRYY